MDTETHNKIVRKLNGRIQYQEKQLTDLIVQCRFYRRENNLLKAKLLQWEELSKTQTSNCRGKRNYANVRVRSMRKKHPDVEWNNTHMNG